MPDTLHLTDDDVRDLGDGDAVIRDGLLLSADLRSCADTLGALSDDGRMRPSGMGRGRVRDSALRGDRIAWRDDLEDVALPGLAALFEGVRAELNAAAWLGLASFSVQLAVYRGEGARYARHRDTVAGDRVRRATAVVYLNPDWVLADGGCLRIHTRYGARDVEPLGGRTVLFLSDRLEHEVLPCHAVRWAATAWFRGYDAEHQG
ncbi:MAG: SM-20-related protein [Myxococcota bacterium]|jgi:SM-20-related protein